MTMASSCQAIVGSIRGIVPCRVSAFAAEGGYGETSPKLAEKGCPSEGGPPAVRKAERRVPQALSARGASERSAKQALIEWMRQQIAHAMDCGNRIEIREDDFHVAGELPQNLTTRATGRRRS